LKKNENEPHQGKEKHRAGSLPPYDPMQRRQSKKKKNKDLKNNKKAQDQNSFLDQFTFQTYRELPIVTTLDLNNEVIELEPGKENEKFKRNDSRTAADDHIHIPIYDANQKQKAKRKAKK